EIISIKKGLKNHFKMDLSQIKGSQGEYFPEILCPKDTSTNEPNGTTLILKNIRRKSGFDLAEIAISLSKKFTILDQLSILLRKNDAEELIVSNELKFSTLEEQFRWDFPNELETIYSYATKIKGSII